MKKFTITEDHMKLLRAFGDNLDWDECEFGAPDINCKRPFGNSSVERDIAEILGWEIDEDEGLTDDQKYDARTIYREMEDVLRIVLKTCPDMTGKYTSKKTRYTTDQKWKRA